MGSLPGEEKHTGASVLVVLRTSSNEEPVGLDAREDPRSWPKSRKWAIMGVMSLMFLVSTTATIACAPASPQIIASFGTTDPIYSTLLVTAWELGEGLGPLLLAPLSELYGRRIAFNGANLAFVVFAVLATVSVNLPMLIVMRFMNGVAVATTTLNPAVVGDLFVTEERGLALALVNLTPLLGPVVGPIVGGYIAEFVGWRWVFGIVSILAGVCATLFLIVFPETYRIVLIRRKAKTMFMTGYGGLAVPLHLKQSLRRPLQLLLFSPVIAILTAVVSVAYAFLFIILTWLPWIFQNRYGFSQGAVGLTYLGPGIGVAFAVLFSGVALDMLVQRHKKAGRTMLPEHRLPVFMVGGVATVAGYLLYGWSAELRMPWIAPIIGSALDAFGLVSMTVAADIYLVDAFESYSASALAALGIVRSLATAGLPLAGPALYNKLGLGWGNTLLGLILAMSIPLALLLISRGERLRAWSRYQIA